MTTSISFQLTCISIQGIWDQTEAQRLYGLDAACECSGIFTSADGSVRLEMAIKDWEFANLAQRGNPVVFAGDIAMSASVVAPSPYSLLTNKPSSILLVSDFMQQFTDMERVAIASNPQTVAMSLKLLGYPTINLADPIVIEDINLLAQAGILTQERATFLLGLKNYDLPPPPLT